MAGGSVVMSAAQMASTRVLKMVDLKAAMMDSRKAAKRDEMTAGVWAEMTEE